MLKLDPNSLEIGMKLAENVCTPAGQVLAEAGEKVTRQLINRMRLYRVEFAAVEKEEKEEPVPEAVEAPAPKAENPSPQEPPKPANTHAAEGKTHAAESKTHSQKVAASSEFLDFQIIYFKAIDQMKASFTGLYERSEPIPMNALLDTVSQLFLSRNTIVELFDMIFNMRTYADAIYSHSLNVALISRMIGRWLKYDTHDLNTLTAAGLLHDIGKLKVPEDVLNKPDALTDAEFALIKQHPRFGYDILKNQAYLDPRVKKAALMHHERSDGSGYPSGLTEDFIDSYAMIVGIADVFDAMTAARSYRAPLCPFQVISNFERDGLQKYNVRFILTFLQQIAAAYQNNRVMLSDGRGCNIIMLNQNDLSRPLVQFDDNTCLDLSTASHDLYIKAVL